MAPAAVVIGGGVGGLTTALALGRAGCHVTVLERDNLPPPEDVEAAFRAPRPGAPQVHQTHGFLARLQQVLRGHFPDVWDALLGAGCTTMSTTMNLGEPEPGDEDLAVLIVRRTTLEWVLRQAVLAEPSVSLRPGVTVTELLGEPAAADRPAVVTGARSAEGETFPAEVVVGAGGRRAAVPAQLRALGVEVSETVRQSGLVYLTRWYRFPDGPQVLADPKLGGDLGFVKFLGVPGDAGTLSVTLAVRSTDTELRRALATGDRFDRACKALPGPDRFFARGTLEPLGPVKPMGGLLNRLRRFTDGAGAPVVLGFHAVGDAHTCTNPLYGRGCSLAAVQAVLLADALAAHPDDATARSAAYEAACTRQVEPWFHVSVEMDKAGADPAGFGGGGPGADGVLSAAESGAANPAAKAFGAVMVAAATDPILGRAMVKFWNLLSTPAELAADVEVMSRMSEVMTDPDRYPLPPRDGPTRGELLLELEAPIHA